MFNIKNYFHITKLTVAYNIPGTIMSKLFGENSLL